MTDAERKRRVAKIIFQAVNRATRQIELEMDDVIEVTTSDVTPLQHHVRVKTRQAGTHYYLVQVKESW